MENATQGLTSGKEKIQEGNTFMVLLTYLWFMLITVQRLIKTEIHGKKTLSSSSRKQTKDPSDLSEPFSNKHNDAKAQTAAITTA